DTADGELIGLFLEEPVPAGLPAIETAERIRAQGGLVYLQHPFYRLVRSRMRDTVREELRGRGLLDVVESANGGPFTAAANARALAWARACGLPHTAASDAHEPSMIGTCLVSAPAGLSTPRRCPLFCARRRRSTGGRPPQPPWRSRPRAGSARLCTSPPGASPGGDGPASAASDARVLLVRPLELHGVVAEPAGLPGADVADLAVLVVVPAVAWHGIGDRLAQLVRARGGEGVEQRQPARAAGAAGVRHDGVEDVCAGGVVVPAERLARAAAALRHRHVRRQVDEVERVRGRA